MAKYYDYKVYNEFGGCSDKSKAGMVLRRTTVTKQEDGTKTYEKDFKTVPEVRAVLLYWSPMRTLRKGKKGEVRCSSHDGVVPSVGIDDPLCRLTTAEDLVQIFSKWKNFDQTKIDAKLEAVTENGKLTVCGIDTGKGCIRLCPFSKKDPNTGAPPACKESVVLFGYDVDRELVFRMELTGKSMRNDANFVSPFFAFLEQAHSAGKSLFNYMVTLKPAENDKYWYLDIADVMPIAGPEMAAEMEKQAEETRERFEKLASRLSKEAYERLQQVSRQASTSSSSGSAFDEEEPF